MSNGVQPRFFDKRNNLMHKQTTQNIVSFIQEEDLKPDDDTM
jgi:hypothetical protein